MLRLSMLFFLSLSLILTGCASPGSVPHGTTPSAQTTPMPLPRPISVLVNAQTVPPQPLPAEILDENGQPKKGFVLKQEGYTYTLWVSLGDPTVVAAVQQVEEIGDTFRAVVRPILAKNEYDEPVQAVRFDYAGPLADFQVQMEDGTSLPRFP